MQAIQWNVSRIVNELTKKGEFQCPGAETYSHLHCNEHAYC